MGHKLTLDLPDEVDVGAELVSARVGEGFEP